MKARNLVSKILGGFTVSACLAGLFSPLPAAASHATVFAPIDAIDTVFGVGGGSFTTTLGSGADDAWFAFGANLGDTLSISVTGSFGPNIVLFAAGTNGLIEVGDVYTSTGAFNGNVNQTGTGIDLIVTSFIFNTPCFGDCYVAPGSSTYSVLASGQYVIGMSAANEDLSFVGPSTISLAGNTREFSVPEPISLALVGIGLASIGLGRRRRNG